MTIKPPAKTETAAAPLVAQKAVASGLKYLAQRWDITGSEIAQLLQLPANTVNLWLSQGRVPLSFGEPRLEARAELVLHLLACQRSLEAMFHEAEQQRLWLRTKHPDFKQAPLDLMKRSIESLIFMRRYLDYARGRGA